MYSKSVHFRPNAYGEEWLRERIKLIIDAHNHLGMRPLAAPQKPGEAKTGQTRMGGMSPEKLLEIMDRAGVDKACSCPYIEGGREGYVNNEYVIESAKKYPDRIIPFGCVSPWWRDVEEYLERLVREGNIKGLKVHPQLHGYPMDCHPLMDPVLEICAKHRLIVAGHGTGDTPFTLPIQYAEMAATFPEVKFIIYHSGAMYLVDQACREIKRHENLYGDTTALWEGELMHLVEEVGPEKVVFGAEVPFGNYEVQFKKVEVAVPDPESRSQIMGKTMARMLGIG